MRKPRKAIKAVIARKPIRRAVKAKIAENPALLEAVTALRTDLAMAVGQVRQIREDVAALRQATTLPAQPTTPPAAYMGTVRNPGR